MALAANSGGNLGAAGAGAGAAGASVSMGETGRLAGMTAAHNARAGANHAAFTDDLVPDAGRVRARMDRQPREDRLHAAHHRSSQELQTKGYGENLAVAGGSRPPLTTAQFAVDGWASEAACWTYGTFAAPGSVGSEKCDSACYQKLNSDGCGHYTQLVWRNSTQLGCGLSSCTSSGVNYDIWICNYAAPGNVVGQKPY